jgi:hypothetical protein
MSLGKKVFTNKTFGAQLYKWSPLPSDKPKNNAPQKPFYCTAIAGSQGQDWISTYSYNLVVVNGQQERLAYVECDYVE